MKVILVFVDLRETTVYRIPKNSIVRESKVIKHPEITTDDPRVLVGALSDIWKLSKLPGKFKLWRVLAECWVTVEGETTSDIFVPCAFRAVNRSKAAIHRRRLQ